MRPPRLTRPTPGDVDPLKFDEEPAQGAGLDDVHAKLPSDSRGLKEVEHALSALAGRHPEHARLEREDLAKADRRRRELARQVVSERTARRMRLVKRILVLAAIAGVFAVIRARITAVNEARDLVDSSAKKFTSIGFSAFTDGWLSANHAEASIAAGTCVVAVAADARGDADVLLDRDGVQTPGHGSIGFCSCAGEHVNVTTRSGGAARILHRAAGDFGGTLGFTLKNVHPATQLDSPCADEHLDAFIASHVDSASGAAKIPLGDDRSAFSLAGFKPLVSESSGAPFVMISAPAETCLLAFAGLPTDTIALRLVGGARPIPDASGSIVWCTAKPAVFSVWRTGASAIQVASAPASRAGGLYGIREVANTATAKITTWIAPDDLAWDATQALRASGIVEIAKLDPESASKMPIPSTRVFALSTVEGATVAPDSSQDILFVSCAPPLEKAESTICVESGPQRWRATTPRGSWGAASSALPFWLAAYASVREPAVVPGELALLTLARKLIRRGFDPTVLGAVKELEHGAEVLGRAGEDSVVAVGIAPEAPWLVPYTDGAPWTLAGEPRVVPLAPGARITLTPGRDAAGLTTPIDARRTIVFRHAVALEKK